MQLKQDVPESHLTFAFKCFLMSDLCYCPSVKEEISKMPDDLKSPISEFYIEDLDAMNAGMLDGIFLERTKANFKALMIPLDTRVYNEKSRKGASAKDLVLFPDKCYPGETKLLANDPVRWMNCLNCGNYLKQLHFPLSIEKTLNSTRYWILAFQSEWPEECFEWLTRRRLYNWPRPEVIAEIKQNGCRVVPKCNPSCKCPLAEWKFCFDKADKVITERAVTEEQRDCFAVVKIALDSVLEEPLPLAQLKHVFFYVCEETDEMLWTTGFAECVWIFLGRLLDCLRSRRIPNYFMSQVNMLEGHVTDQNITKCIKYIDIVQKHPFAVMYFACDKYSNVDITLSKSFDKIVEDTRQYSLKRDLNASIRLCFLPIIADTINELIKRNKYMVALQRCQKATEKLNKHLMTGEKLYLQDVILHVIFLSDSQINQWLFAFVADQELGTFLIESVCEGKESVSIFKYYGTNLAENLRMQTSDILIPFDLVCLQNLAETTCSILDILEGICTPVAYREVLLFFLSNHMNKVVRYFRNESTAATKLKFVSILLDKISGDVKKLIGY